MVNTGSPPIDWQNADIQLHPVWREDVLVIGDQFEQYLPSLQYFIRQNEETAINGRQPIQSLGLCDPNMGETSLEQRPGNDPLSTMILSEVAEQEDIDPIDLSPPIYTAIDTDALEKLFFGKTDGFARVEFTYAGHQILIQGDEVVQIEVE